MGRRREWTSGFTFKMKDGKLQGVKGRRAVAVDMKDPFNFSKMEDGITLDELKETYAKWMDISGKRDRW